MKKKFKKFKNQKNKILLTSEQKEQIEANRKLKEQKKLLHSLNGVVIKNLSNLHFKVELFPGVQINAYVAGKLRLHKIRIAEGDKVKVQMSLYNPLQGRIIEREKRTRYKVKSPSELDLEE